MPANSESPTVEIKETIFFIPGLSESDMPEHYTVAEIPSNHRILPSLRTEAPIFENNQLLQGLNLLANTEQHTSSKLIVASFLDEQTYANLAIGSQVNLNNFVAVRGFETPTEPMVQGRELSLPMIRVPEYSPVESLAVQIMLNQGSNFVLLGVRNSGLGDLCSIVRFDVAKQGSTIFMPLIFGQTRPTRSSSLSS